ncbi:hypothetical protein [Bradyrhizobium sp. CSA112]|uniref:hypothetical protein n=1 Tax=Bradyrhizobium sp. CSA112 TaxID=2699170 RepID=UPI0023AFE029|nr:hypothetical protein [Bradyrhizobium sp. CSA112]
MCFWQIAFSIFLRGDLHHCAGHRIVAGDAVSSQTADPEPKRVMMLHSFGLRFRPWTDYSEALRAELAGGRPWSFKTTRYLMPGANSDKSDAPFVEYLRTLNIDQPPDLIIAIGAPAANFVQGHRKDFFATTPMLFTGVKRHRAAFDKLTEIRPREFSVGCEMHMIVWAILTTVLSSTSSTAQPVFWRGVMCCQSPSMIYTYPLRDLLERL